MKATELMSLIERHFDPEQWWTAPEFRDLTGRAPRMAMQTLIANRKIARRVLQRDDPRRSRKDGAFAQYEYRRLP